MQAKLLKWVFVFVSFAWVMVACAGSDTRHPAERAVANYYVALNDDDSDALMDAVEPADRNVLTTGLMSLLDSLSVSIGPLGVDLGQLTDVSIRDLRLDVAAEAADYALVRAAGVVRYLALGTEVPFCFMHDVRRAGNAWYIDLDGPENAERLARILPARQAEAAALAASSGDSLAAAFDVMNASMAIAMNQCE